MLDNKKDLKVKKAEEIITSKHNLSLLAIKIMDIIISGVQENDNEDQKYSFFVKDFKKLAGIRGNNIHYCIKEAVRELMQDPLEIHTDTGWFMCNWIAGGKYIDAEGRVECSIYPDLKPYLLQLKNCFTQYALKNVLELKSKYAFRLYELLKQYQSIGRRKFSVSELRDLLGVEQGELKLWVHFKTRVLEIAKREINQKTDLEINYKTEKVGRRIEYIIFSIQAQDKEKIKKVDEQNKRYDELLKLVPEKYRELKTLKSAIVKYFKKKGFEYVKRNIEYANLKAEKNYRAYLINALKEDWAADWQDDQKVQQIEVQESVKAELKAKKKLEQKHELHELQIQKNKEKLRELRAKLGRAKLGL